MKSLRRLIVESSLAPIYQPAFHPEAIKEWTKIDGSIRTLFTKALKKLAHNPRVEGCELQGILLGCYKIKRRKIGYRLVYFVDDKKLLMKILSVGRREENEAYKSAEKRLEFIGK